MPKEPCRIQQAGAVSNYFDLLVDQLLVTFVAAAQFERIRDRSLALLHTGDYVRASEPMRLSQISLRPARRMVGMRVVKPDNVFAALAAFALDANQFPGINVIAVLRR